MSAVPQSIRGKHDGGTTPESAIEATAPVQPRELRDRLRMPLMLLAPVLIIGIGTYIYFTGGRFIGTDDAYVRAAQLSVSANLSGRVTELRVHDNQLVHRGDVMFKLDDASLRIAVAEAQAQLGKARLQVEGMKAVYRQRQADVMAARDTVNYRRSEYERQQRLLDKGIASQAQLDAAGHARDSAEQNYNAAQQQLAAALADLAGNPGIALDKHPLVMEAQAQLDRGQLNLTYATVTAPQDGVVTKVERLQVGSYINASQPVFALVSTTDVWVEANFKEVQVAHMHPGQHAEVVIDAFPDKTFDATVTSFSPGTGNEFSVLPAENATGNWVKVVQRIPVRLNIKNLPTEAALQSGLSASVKVDTEYQRHLFATNDVSGGAAH